MPNVPPKRDPNRPKPRAAQGARAVPDAPPQKRIQSNDDAKQDAALERQDERRGGIGERRTGGYPEQQPKAPRGKR